MNVDMGVHLESPCMSEWWRRKLSFLAKKAKCLLKIISLDTDSTPHNLPDLKIHAIHAIHAVISSSVYVKQSLKEKNLGLAFRPFRKL
jgi:hypothetical protein